MYDVTDRPTYDVRERAGKGGALTRAGKGGALTLAGKGGAVGTSSNPSF